MKKFYFMEIILPLKEIGMEKLKEIRMEKLNNLFEIVDRNAENVFLVLIGRLTSAQQNLFANYMPN